MAWDLDFEEGGGGLNGATGVIVDAFFREGEYGWSWTVVSTFDDPENYPKFEDGQFTRHFSLPKGWVSLDGGKTAVHETGDETKRYNKNSQAAQFALALAKIDGIQQALPDFSPYVAASVKGAHLVWQNVPIEKRAPKKDAAGNDVIEDGKVVWESVPGATALYPVALAGHAPTGNGQGSLLDVSTLGLTDTQINELSVVAQTCDTDGKFIEAIAKNADVIGNSTFMGAVSKNASGVREALAAATF